MSWHEWKLEEDCASGAEALSFLGPASCSCLLRKNLFNACKNGSSSVSVSVSWGTDRFCGLPMAMGHLRWFCGNCGGWALVPTALSSQDKKVFLKDEPKFK